MKICTYCKKEELDNADKCSSCGSNELINRCNKCGTEFSSAFCPTCGSAAGEQAKVCPNCGEKCFDPYCPKCGTDLSGRQARMNNKRYGETTTTVINISNDMISTPQTHHHQRKMSRRKMVTNVSLLVLFMIAIIISFQVTNMDKKVKMVMKEGHPLYYGSIEEAQEFFQGNTQITILQKGETEYTGNETVVITSLSPNSDTIGDIYFNFSNLNKSKDYSIDDMVDIISDYLPFDIIDKYYSFDSSFMEESKDGDFIGYYYIMTLNDEGKALNSAIYQDTLAFKITRDQHYNWVMEISSKSGESKEYPKEAWDVKLTPVSGE